MSVIPTRGGIILLKKKAFTDMYCVKYTENI